MKKGILLVLAACGAPPSPAPVPPPRVVASAAPSATPRAPASSAAPLVAPARVPLSAWSKEPEASGDLYTVLDGECRHLDVSPIGDTTFAHWGATDHLNIARLADDGITFDEKLSGVRATDRIHRLVGSLPDRLYMEADNGMRWGLYEVVKRWTGEKWTDAFALPEGMGANKLEPYMGGAIGLRTCGSGGEDPACKPGIYMGDNVKAPPITGDAFQVQVFKSLPDGTAFAIGTVCSAGCTGQLRWWKPGGKLGHANTVASQYGVPGDLFVRSATEVYVTQGSYFGSFDGQKLTKETAPGNDGGPFVPLADGGFAVVADKKLWKREGTGFTDITPPKFAGTADGFTKGSPWMIGDKGVVQKQVDGVWKEVTLPAPARATSPKSFLTPERLVVIGKDDAVIVASYFELHDGWQTAEKRRVLLRTKRPKETLSCEPDALGLRSWPAAARPDCTTPFVVLAQVSATSPKDYDFPKTRATFKSYATDIKDASLVEVEENGKRWIGFIPTSLASGDKLVTLYSKQVSPLHAQMVCMTPPSPRMVPIVQ